MILPATKIRHHAELEPPRILSIQGQLTCFAFTICYIALAGVARWGNSLLPQLHFQSLLASLSSAFLHLPSILRSRALALHAHRECSTRSWKFQTTNKPASMVSNLVLLRKQKEKALRRFVRQDTT